MRDKGFVRQKESLPQLESVISADEQARLLNNPPLSFRNYGAFRPVDRNNCNFLPPHGPEFPWLGQVDGPPHSSAKTRFRFTPEKCVVKQPACVSCRCALGIPATGAAVIAKLDRAFRFWSSVVKKAADQYEPAARNSFSDVHTGSAYPAHEIFQWGRMKSDGAGKHVAK